MALADETMLTAEERRERHQKRQRLIITLIVVLVLLLVGIFTARPVAHAIKAFQARRHAREAFALIDKQDWSAARNEAVAAYQLYPKERQAIRAVARFLSRVRQPEALEFWTQLRKIDKLTVDDLRDEAAIALMAGEAARATDIVHELVSRKDSAPIDWLLAAQSAQQNNEHEQARQFAAKAMQDQRADQSTQLQGAILVLVNTPAAKSDALGDAAWTRLKKLSTGSSQAALDTLVVLAQFALSQNSGGTTSVSSPDTTERVPPTPASPQSELRDPKSIVDLAQRLESHPLAKAQHKLLAVDLRIKVDESHRDALIAAAVNEWKNSDPDSLNALAVWLNGKGEFQMTLGTIGLDRALQTREVFLQYLDALAGLERWSEVKRLLTGEKFPLDPVVQQMYLARCSAQLGEKAAAENSWSRALEAAGGDVTKLVMLGNYAEKNGNIDIAEKAYTNAALAAPKLRVAQQGRLRIAQQKRDTRKLHAVLADMLAIWPKDAAVQNDEAYTRLLLLGSNSRNDEANTVTRAAATSASPAPADSRSNELKEIESVAQKLIARDPASFPHRTLLALARLRQGRAADALRVYDNIQVAPNALTASALAVHAAVLAANGNRGDAQTEIEKIKPEQLLPEEQALLAPK